MQLDSFQNDTNHQSSKYLQKQQVHLKKHHLLPHSISIKHTVKNQTQHDLYYRKGLVTQEKIFKKVASSFQKNLSEKVQSSSCSATRQT